MPHFRRQNQLSSERTRRLQLSKEKRCDRRQSSSESECVKKQQQEQNTAEKVNVTGVTSCKSQRMLTTRSVGNHRKQRTVIYIFHKIWIMIYVHSDRITVSTNKDEETKVTGLKPRVNQVTLQPVNSHLLVLESRHTHTEEQTHWPSLQLHLESIRVNNSRVLEIK